MAASRTKAITLAGSPAFHPPGAVARHAAALERRQSRLARDRDAGASEEVLAAHEVEVVRLTKAVRRSQRRVDRLAVLRAERQDLAEKRVDNAELKARLAAKEAAEDEQAKNLCKVVIGRIQKREADARARRKLETPQERHRANQQRRRLKLNPHVERDATIKPGRRIVTDPTKLGGFVEVQVNKQLDVLTMEHSASRISDQEFAVGRLLQEAWTGNSDSADRRMERMARLGVMIDSREEEELAPREMGMLREVFRLRAVAKLDEKLAGIVGWTGVRFLKAILVEGHTLKSYASCTVGGGDRGVGRVGDRFRWLLESVTDHFHTAEGARRYAPDDIYSADAATVPDRIAALKARAEDAEASETAPA